MTIEQIIKAEDRRYYLDVLAGEECHCGRQKFRGKALCFLCYRKLPNLMQSDLYKRIGKGFEQAYEDAIKYLSE